MGRRYVAGLNGIKHNGKDYAPGEEVPDAAEWDSEVREANLKVGTLVEDETPGPRNTPSDDAQSPARQHGGKNSRVK